jgi:hypothetical protein
VGSAERPTSRSEYRRKETEIPFEIELLLHYRGPLRHQIRRRGTGVPRARRVVRRLKPRGASDGLRECRFGR